MLINNIAYKTQKSLKSKVTSVIANLNASSYSKYIEIDSSSDFFNFWKDLFKRHPTKGHFNPTSFTFEKPCNMYFNVDNYRDSFSYNVCITGKMKNKTIDYFDCLRSSIEPQIKAFRNKSTPLKCNSCNITDDIKYEVDHVITFKTLYEDFIQTVDGVEIDDLKMKYNSTRHRTLFDLSDQYTKSLHDLWVEYHDENAVLQILCRKCHILKTKSKTLD